MGGAEVQGESEGPERAEDLEVGLKDVDPKDMLIEVEVLVLRNVPADAVG